MSRLVSLRPGARPVCRVVCIVLAVGGPGWARAAEPAASARVSPVSVPVAAEVVLDLVITPGRALGPGAVVSTQLPSAMLAADLSYSLTKSIQVRDARLAPPAAAPAGGPPPAGAAPGMPANFQQFTRWHTVTVDVPAQRDVTFDVKIEKREIELGKADSRHGQAVHATVTAGTIPAGADVVFTYRTTAPWVASREYRVYAAIDGMRVSPDASFAVTPGPAETHRLIVPSSAKPGEAFPVRFVSLDRYSNVAATPVAVPSLTDGARVLAKGFTYTGRHQVSVSLPRPGVYRLAAGGTRSNPIRITSNPSGPFWGDLHNHNDADHDAASGGNSHEYARDVSALDFYALSNHVNGGAPFYWTRAQQRCREFYVPGEFVPLLAFETALAVAPIGPHMTATFADCDQPPPPHLQAGKRSVAMADLGAYLEARAAVTAVHHTGVIWAPNDFRANRAFFPSTRAIEIYSSHGQSERYDPSAALSYEHQVSAPFTLSVQGDHYAQDAWRLGHRLTAVGSSDDHNGQPGKPFNGVTAVSAERLDRASIFSALQSGASYATTGERVLLDFRVSGRPMGSIVTVPAGTPLACTLEVHGTGPIAQVEVLRYVTGEAGWQVAHALRNVGKEDVTDAWQDTPAGPAIYYVRVVQATEQEVFVPVHGRRPVTAWSSPIWVENAVR